MPLHLAAMDITPSKRGSFENYTVALARRLRDAGWQSIQAFWGPPPAWLRQELEDAGAGVRVISAEPEFGGVEDWPPGLSRDLRFSRVLRRWVGAERPDVAHLHFCLMFSLIPLSLRLAGARNIVFTEHISLPFAERDPLRDMLSRVRNGLCTACIDRVLPVSGYVERRLIESDHVPRAKTQVIYNGIELGRFQTERTTGELDAIRDRLGVPERHRIVLTIGQMIDFKGMHVLVDAASVLAGLDDVVYLFVGEGEKQASLERQARELGLGERVRFLGRRDDIGDLLSVCDLFVCPSIWDEALGYVVVEAMAAGNAVVATRTGGIPEVVVDRDTGLLVERNDASALAGAMRRLLGDPARRGRMGAAGRARVAERFSMAGSIEQTLALYQTLTGGDRGAGSGGDRAAGSGGDRGAGSGGDRGAGSGAGKGVALAGSEE